MNISRAVALAPRIARGSFPVSHRTPDDKASRPVGLAPNSEGSMTMPQGVVRNGVRADIFAIYRKTCRPCMWVSGNPRCYPGNQSQAISSPGYPWRKTCRPWGMWSGRGANDVIRIVTTIFATIDNSNVADHVVDVSQTQLSERQQKIYLLIKESPTITAKQMSQTLSVSQRTIQRDLSTLKEMGVLKHEGNDNDGMWVVLTHNKNVY